MKAIAYYQSLPADHAEALVDIDLPAPQPGPRDLLVEVRAISVNPVDTKIRQRVTPEAGQPKVLGWDVAGVVVEVGAEVRQFRPGDQVFYAGAIDRAGANSELHVVDERIVGRMQAAHHGLQFVVAALAVDQQQDRTQSRRQLARALLHLVASGLGLAPSGLHGIPPRRAVGPSHGYGGPLSASSTAVRPPGAATRVTQTTRGRPTLVETAPRFGGADLSAGPTERIPDPRDPCSWRWGG